MKKVFAAFTVICAFLFFSAAAHAGVILIHNETGFDLWEIYLSDSGTNDWEEDILGNNILEADTILQVNVTGSWSNFDMRAVDEEGNTCDWFGLPGNASEIAIYADGTAEYQ